MTKESKYLLATYIDGPYFKSALELLLYPTGCSFYRPFSFRKNLVDTDIEGTHDGSNEYSDGFIGMRFLDQGNNGTRPHFIPLRRIYHINIISGDIYHARFRLGSYIHHAESDIFLYFDLSKKLPDKYSRNNDLLFATISGRFANELNQLPITERIPPDLWDKFTKDPSLKKEAISRYEGACVIQLTDITTRGTNKPLKPSKLENKIEVVNNSWGYLLEVGKIYDLNLIFRALVSKGTITELGNISFECSEPEERLHLSRNRIPQTGNYREERIWLQPRRPEPAPIWLEWEPKYKNEQGSQTTSFKASPPLRIQFLVKPLSWAKFKPGLFWIGVIFWLAALLFFSFAVISSNNSRWPEPVIWVALGGVCAPIGANFVSKWVDERSKHKQ